jgi:hypothetical protein
VSSATIPPLTEQRLNEVERYLVEMGRVEESDEKYRRLVSDCLSALISIEDVVINETSNKELVSCIRRSIHTIPDTNVLVKVRNRSLHHGRLDLRTEWVEEGIFGSPGAEPGLNDFYRRRRLREIESRQRNPYRVRSTTRVTIPGQPPVKHQWPRSFFKGIPDRDAYTVCNQYLAAIRRVTQECVDQNR